MKKEVFEAIATLVGVVIGAGILGIPYVIAKSGLLVGIIDILIIGATMLMMNLFLGEIVLRTRGDHQLTGYAEIYLGQKGKFFMTLAMFIGTYGALTAYLIGEGKVLSAIFGGPEILYSLIFFLIVSIIVANGIKMVEKAELLFVTIFLTIIIAICAIAIFHTNTANWVEYDFTQMFLPFGVVLFAFLGSAAIPEMREELINHRKDMKKAILIGSCIPIIVYLLFAAAVVGVSGKDTTEIATIGLGQNLGEGMIILSNIFAMLTMTTAFIALSLAIVEVWNYDYKLKRKFSLWLTLSIPLIAFLLGIKSFINTIGIVGAFAGGIEGILIVMMMMKARKYGNRTPEYSIKGAKIISVLIMTVFILGMAYVVLKNLKMISF